MVSRSARSVQIYPSRRVRRTLRMFVGPFCVCVPWFASVRCREIAVLRMKLIGYPLRLKTHIKCFSSFAFNCGVLQCVSALLKSLILCNSVCGALGGYYCNAESDLCEFVSCRRTFPIDHFVFCVPQRPGKGSK